SQMRNPIKTGKRVYLRPEEPDDAGPMALMYSRETDDFTDSGGRYPMSPITFKHLIERDATNEQTKNVTLVSCLRENDEVIGYLGFFDIDPIHRTAETFSHFAPGEWRGRGYGTESKFLLLEYGFDDLHLHIIQSYVWGANERSARALAKQGYRPAGRLRWDDVRRGVYLDTLLFDIKRDEWIAEKARWDDRVAELERRP
ncbi:MAG: GNAT family N-acetyltransferase, partial [Chloroflexota bacterium]